VVYI